jgi:tyrosyl-tRNA synthetase
MSRKEHGKSEETGGDLEKRSVGETYAQVTRDLQEVLGAEEIRKTMAERSLKIYWGTATTGMPHIGYLVPILKLADFVEAGCTVTVLLADLHAFLDNLKAPLDLVELRSQCYEAVIRALLESVGTRMDKIRFVKGSDFQLCREYTMDVYRLSTQTTMRAAQRAGAQVVKQADDPLLSSLIYPGMQALDEQYLDVDAQFGGVDQRKIFIYAEKFLPMLGYRKRAHLMSPMVPGLGAGKMSSSEESSKIGLTDTDAVIKKKVAKAFCEEGNVEVNGVLSLVKFLVLPMKRRHGGTFAIEMHKSKEMVEYEEYEQLERDFRERKVHPGDLKEAAWREVAKIIAPIRARLQGSEKLIAEAYPGKKGSSASE